MKLIFKRFLLKCEAFSRSIYYKGAEIKDDGSNFNLSQRNLHDNFKELCNVNNP